MTLITTTTAPTVLHAAGGGTLQSHGLATFADGSAVSVWDEGQSIRGRLVTADGTPDTGFVANGSDGNRPDVAVLSNGNFIVAWTGNGIMARLYDAQGTALGGSFTLYDADGLEIAPRLAALPGGGFAMHHTGFEVDGSFFSAHLGTFDNSGNPVMPVALVNQTTDRFQSFGDVTALANGGTVVTWRSHEVDGSYYAAMMRIYDAEGLPVSNEIRLNQYALNAQTGPVVAELANGTLVAAWDSEDQDGSEEGVYARLFSADGLPLGDEFQVNTQTFGMQWRPDLLALETGGFVIAWGDGADGDIFGRVYDANGVALSDATALTTLPGVEFGPELAAIGGNGFAVSWATTDYGVGFAGFTTNLASSGDDTITATSDPEQIDADSGHDLVSALGGDDTLLGGLGDDTLRGGRGADTLDGGEGRDQLFGQGHGDLLTGGDQSDTLKGGGGNDTLQGDAGDDFLKGGTRKDVLRGGQGDDKLAGNAFDDTLSGGAGNDTLIAGGDADRLEGGTGDDILRGGDGVDAFVFDLTEDTGNDVIEDFDLAADRLEITLAAPPAVGDSLLSAREHAEGTLMELANGGTVLFLGLDFTRLNEMTIDVI